MVLLALAVLSIVVIAVLATAAPRASKTRNVGRRARRVGLGVFFVSVAVNAALGIYAVLAPDFGDTAGKILVTSLSVTGATLMALCCEPAWERRLLTPVPAVGALLDAAAFAGLIVGIWTEPDSAALGRLLASTFAAAIACTVASAVVLERARKRVSLAHTRVITLALGVIALAAAVAVALIWTSPSNDTIGNFVGTGSVAAVACVLAAFLTLARLAPGHRWVLAAALALLAAGVVLVVANIWLPDTWGLTRAMGVTLIAFAALMVTVPVLHWLDRGIVAVAAATGDAIRYCPHCGRKLSGEIGVEAHCERCGRGFTVTAPIPT